MHTITDAAQKLAEIEALKKGKKSALDAVLMKTHRGRLSPKREAAEAAALAQEQREVNESRSALVARKRAAYRAMDQALRVVGRPHGVYVWKYVTSLDSYEARAYPRGFILEGKPAEADVRRMLR